MSVGEAPASDDAHESTSASNAKSIISLKIIVGDIKLEREMKLVI